MKPSFSIACYAALFAATSLYADTAPKDPLVNGSPDSPTATGGGGSATGTGGSATGARRLTVEGPAPAVGRQDLNNVSIRYEVFSLSLADAAALQRENLSDPAGYAKLVAMVAKKEAKQETLTVLRTKSGQKATAESIFEQIYPTEYETPSHPDALGVSIVPRKAPPPSNDGTAPPKSPATIPDSSKLADAPTVGDLAGVATPATPTGFTTRNVGDTLEIEPNVGDDEHWIDLRLVPERVTRVGTSIAGQGLSRTEMPEFESQRVNTGATVEVGKPFLLGTLNRPPVSKGDADSANRIWFAFVTADYAKR